MSDDQNTIDGLELISCVASGTHSQIWEVSEPGGSQHFAVKLLVPDAMEDKENISVLKHEAKVQKSLTHPNFITFHRVVANKQHAYILMDYFRAPNLKTQLMTDVMALQMRATKLIEGIAVALGFMHDKGWVHRDVKPENILLNKSGELKLIDFSLSLRYSSGIGKMFSGSPKTIQGTRTYIAPETILKKAPTPRTDIYSLGVTLFEILAGQRPFTAPTPDVLLNKHLKEMAPAPSEFNKNVTPEADEFIRRMLAKKPEKRQANMNELLAEFRAIKLFKEDVAELKARADAKRKEIEETGGDLSKAWTLDSRQDAARTRLGIAPPPKPKSKRSPPPKTSPQKPAPQPQQQQQPQPMPYPPQPYPGQMPQYAPPGFAPPGMHAPQQPYPQQPYPGQPYPPQTPYPQQQPPPGYPQYPQGMPPGQQQPPPGAPQPGAQQPGAQQPGGQQPGPPPAQQQQPPQQQQPQQQQPPEQQPAQQQPAQQQPAQQQPAQQQPAQQQPAQQQPAQQQPAATQSEQEKADVISREEAELRPQAPLTGERHASQTDDDRDLPLMDELPDIL